MHTSKNATNAYNVSMNHGMWNIQSYMTWKHATRLIIVHDEAISLAKIYFSTTNNDANNSTH